MRSQSFRGLSAEVGKEVTDLLIQLKTKPKEKLL